jgi:hypothetical protein
MLRMSTWVTDVRHLPPAQPSDGATTGTRRAAFMRAIVEAATSRATEDSWCSAVRCIARVGRKECRARIHVGQPEAGRVEWSCMACGERGVIKGFEGTALDLSSYVPRKKVGLWGFDDDSREVLLVATTHIPSLRAVVARASPAAEVEGLLILQATLDELDEMYTLVEDLSDLTRSRRRLELFDGLRADLCAVMDGF